jgi:hypothetical protein
MFNEFPHGTEELLEIVKTTNPNTLVNKMLDKTKSKDK